MFKRAHHQRIARLLAAFDKDRLSACGCFFGGGTAIVLALGEYRESVDIDFLCSSTEGFRELRNTVNNDLGALLATPVRHLRDVRTDQYKVLTVLEIDGTPVKVELMREARIAVEGAMDASLGVPVLSRVDSYAEKLLANADRALDRSVMSRDIIDLAMMLQGWGPIPLAAWAKAYAAYGDQLSRAFHKAVGMVSDSAYLRGCLDKMGMDRTLLGPMQAALHTAAAALPLNAAEALEKSVRVAGLLNPGILSLIHI